MVLFLIIMAVVAIAGGLANMKQTVKSIELTQSKSIFNFVKKRQ